MSVECIIVDADGLDGPQLYRTALSLLSEDRRKKAESFHFAKDRKLSAVAGLFFRYVELKYGVKISLDAKEKPQTDRKDVNFNVSHSGRMVVFAVSDTPVGIDVETIGDNLDLVNTVMTSSEREAFAEIPEEDRKTVFCRMWTVKESYMKAVGSGLSIPPDSFAVVGKDGMRHTGFPNGLQVRELDAPGGYCVSVCSEDPQDAVLESKSCIELIDIVSYLVSSSNHAYGGICQDNYI